MARIDVKWYFAFPLLFIRKVCNIKMIYFDSHKILTSQALQLKKEIQYQIMPFCNFYPFFAFVSYFRHSNE